jgi:glutaminyl-tRNA synthetase
MLQLIYVLIPIQPKKSKEYVDAIVRPEWPGFQWVNVASDYFQQLYDWAATMIKNGKAYVDSQSSKWLLKRNTYATRC